MTVLVCRLDEAKQMFTDDPVFVCRLDKAMQTFIDDFLFAGWTKQCRHLLMTFCLQAGQSSADVY